VETQTAIYAAPGQARVARGRGEQGGGGTGWVASPPDPFLGMRGAARLTPGWLCPPGGSQARAQGAGWVQEPQTCSVHQMREGTQGCVGSPGPCPEMLRNLLLLPCHRGCVSPARAEQVGCWLRVQDGSHLLGLRVGLAFTGERP